MKVWIGDKAHASSGGMYRVYDGLYEYLPHHGIEIVSDKEDADVLNPHIGMWGDFPTDKPIVMSSHGMLWKENGWGKIANKVNSECLQAYRRADVVTAPSEFVSRSIARYTGAVPHTVRHGIDVEEWKSAPSKGYVLWNKARVDSASNPFHMNELAKRASDIIFYSTHGVEDDNVFVFGRLSPEDMQEMVSQAGVYLATSKESGGPCFGVLEAMACEVPVLSWNFGGTAEVIVHGETGYLAKPYDYEDLATGLRYCIEHRDRLGYNARQQCIDKYQWKDVIKDYVTAYEQALINHNTKVSIIIPCYNLSEFLPRCLDSCIEQAYSNIEIIVINDNSTDNSWEIIKDYAGKDNRIIPLNLTENKHVSYARNYGIAHSSGQFILPLDADDRLYPNSVSILVAELLSDRSVDIAAGKLHIYHETDLDGAYHMSGWPNNADLKLQLEGYNRLPYCSLYRRKVWERVGGYRTRIRNGVEDADFWTRALSYGYKATILNTPTLRYTHRENSLGKQNDKGSAVWLNWFPWVEDTSPAKNTALSNFSPPKVSVVIPVGPGHGGYVQSCVDGVLSQTEEDWEIILINDTGQELKNIPGFVRVINNATNKGVAYSRNRGVESALADKIVFLDVDDTIQPHALQTLLAAHEYAGGWIYGDWYINRGDDDVEYSEAEDWNYRAILQRSLGPITGIYEKQHITDVGGFTEDILGWEDWEFHLKLLHRGVCGTRIKSPLITYNMNLGWRREDNFTNRNNLLKYIREKHYEVLKDKNMGCSSCGGRRTLSVTQKPKTGGNNMQDLIQLKYLGEEKGRNRVASKIHKGTHYIFTASKPLFMVFADEVDYMLKFVTPGGNPMFEVVRQPAPPADEIAVKESPLISQEVPVQFREPEYVESLLLEEHVVEKLRKGGFSLIADIDSADDAQLLAVKGIGKQRVDEIREAVLEYYDS